MSETMQARLAAALADRYRIERELGRGGMATVYLAEDLKHHRLVAIKVLDPEVAAAIGPERFLREIETAASLQHPHILPLFDSGAANGLLYYVMPFVAGESLRDRLTREKQLPVEDALAITREVADALDEAHRHGIVHRDIKPENVLFEGRHAVVADFGIARAVAAGGEKLTATGIAVGTPTYMSPEQAAGSRDLDGRSDLYSLGCVLYEMLAGVPPFTGPTAESLAHQHLNVAARLVTDLRPSVAPAVRDALTKALAKTPADRFTTTGEFATVLVASAVPTGTLSPTPGVAPAVAPPRPRRWVLPAVGVLAAGLIAVAAWQEWWPFGGGHAPPPGKKDWILVAEFEGPADDSTLAAAVRSLVSAALDQSELVTTVSRDQIELALQQAGKPANTRVSAAVARELAYRRSVRAVLEGDIARIGQGYSVVLRVVDAESLKVVVTERGSARNEDALIPVLNKLAEKLRGDLGERKSAIAATREERSVVTPSFEAYRRYIQAVQSLNSGDQQGAIPFDREALRLDPDFASAWLNMGMAYTNLGRVDSAGAAYDQASRRTERLTPRQRLVLQAQLANLEGDYERALATYEQVIQLEPDYWPAYNNGANQLDWLGRSEEALPWYQEAERRSPFGASPALLGSQIDCLLRLGRVDQARELARRISGPNGPVRRTQVELAACNWAAAESMAAARAVDPKVGISRRVGAFQSLALAQAGRGSLRTALVTLLQSMQAAQRASLPNQINAGRALLHASAETQGAIPVPSDLWAEDSSTAALLFRGLRAAMTGDQAAARELLDLVRKRSVREMAAQGASPVLLEARVAALAGRWADVVRLLQPVAAQSVEIGRYSSGALPAARCLLADAFEKLGAPDSAAAYLERITTDPYAGAYWGGIAQPLAHRRLILLYARMGRLADAERHLAVLERWWDRPDDIARRMLDEARSAVRSARGMVRPERPRT